MKTRENICNTQIDYSQVMAGDRIIPFVLTLDLANSVLNPGPGENQRFCYIVTGTGADEPQFADLSHLVLGICEQITEDQIVNITVTIDGVPQEVTFGEGGNVELRTPQNPDPTTGCAGLKFDFGLDKVDGVMNFCFELTTPFSLGPNPVCLSGGGETASGLSICGPACNGANVCESVTFQGATVCVPVTVTPFAIPGETTTVCCGDPVVTPGAMVCPSPVNRSCHFTVTQRICTQVPIAFGANTFVGDPNVACEDASNETCANCVADSNL